MGANDLPGNWKDETGDHIVLQSPDEGPNGNAIVVVIPPTDK